MNTQSAPGTDNTSDVQLKKCVTIDRTAEELYEKWKDFSSFPLFMEHLVSVRPAGLNRTHWIAKGPGNTKVEWDAATTADTPGKVIAWKSLPGADVPNEGSVHFDPAPVHRGTRVTVTLSYAPPGGSVARWAAMIFGEEPDKQISDDLSRFKALMETGVVPTTDGQSKGNN
ncbi:MAG TPA: SRPBCC family protein [Candidatus Methylacidiphilales bacterium]|nr:SRPBCC family protein [Candidatus Methylacidiphilales bacterium]